MASRHLRAGGLFFLDLTFFIGVNCMSEGRFAPVKTPLFDLDPSRFMIRGIVIGLVLGAFLRTLLLRI